MSSGLRHGAGDPMDLERDGNLIEAGVWFLLAVVLFFHTMRSEARLRSTLIVLVSVIAIFGVSDLVEARTGAWWKPWWLFAWKAACVAVLFFGFLYYHRLTKKAYAKAVNAEPTLPRE
jgi:hypothetical protein